MLKRFLKDGLVYGLAGILSRGVSLILVPLYARALAPADYGMVDMLIAFASLVNLTVALEISQGLARLYPEAETPGERVALASTALWFTLAAYSIFWALAALGAGQLSALLLESSAQRGLVLVALASIWASGLFYLVQNQLRWALQPRLYAAASLTMTGVTLGASVLLVVGFRLGVFGVAWAQLAGNAAGLLMGLYLARDSFRPKFDWAKCRAMLRFSVPLVPSSVAVFVALYIDRIAIKGLMTLADVGLFGVGYRLASVTGLAMLGFQGALMPLVYTYYREADTPLQLARIFRYFAAFALVLCTGLSLFARDILVVFTTPAYVEGAGVVPLLAPAVLLSSMYIFAPGLAIAKRTGALALLNIAGAGLNTALNFALIPVLGIRGAALATLVSAASVFGIYMVASQRLYPVPHSWAPLGTAALGAVAVVWAAGALDLPPLAAAATKLLLVAAIMVLFVELGLVRRDEIRRGVGLVWSRAGRAVAQ